MSALTRHDCGVDLRRPRCVRVVSKDRPGFIALMRAAASKAVRTSSLPKTWIAFFATRPIITLPARNSIFSHHIHTATGKVTKIDGALRR